MIIKSLKLIEDSCESYDEFDSNTNQFYSSDNTQGKTTYIRLLTYSFGFDVPSTKGIKFEKIITTVVFEEKEQTYSLTRYGNSILLKTSNSVINYVLPMELNKMFSYIFKYTNEKVFENFLGVLLIDQDKGWTIFDKGNIYPNINFNLDNFFKDLAQIDIDDIDKNIKILEEQKNKFESIVSIQSISKMLYKDNKEIIETDKTTEIKKLARINFRIKQIENNISEINEAIENNDIFFDNIKKMNLYVKYMHGNEEKKIPVTKETLINSKINYESLHSQKNVLIFELEKLLNTKKRIENKIQLQMSNDILDSKLINEYFNNFQTLNEINQANLLNKIVVLKDEIKILNKKKREKITESIKSLHLIDVLRINFMNNCKKLGVEQYISKKTKHVLKIKSYSISGVILQKIIIALKVSLIKLLDECLKTKLPLIIDSPGAKEANNANLNLIFNFSVNELPNNQIFIASVNKFKCAKTIIFNGRAVAKKQNL